MKLTNRDIKLVRDIALSHVVSRDQLMALGYFQTVTRVNTRLRALRTLGLVRRMESPFFGQSLYTAGSRAKSVVGERIAAILAGRLGSPRFVQHALSVTNVRIALSKQGADSWKFEQQARTPFSFAGAPFEVRPDGIAQFPSGLTLVEVDLGHVNFEKFSEKLETYRAFLSSGECQRVWHVPTFRLLTITTSQSRATRLANLIPSNCGYAFSCQTFESLSIPKVESWS